MALLLLLLVLEQLHVFLILALLCIRYLQDHFYWSLTYIILAALLPNVVYS